MQSFDLRHQTRRHFFQNCGVGVGKIALASLLAKNMANAEEATSPAAPQPSPFPPKAKRVIYLFMAGRRASWSCSTASRCSRSWRASRSRPR